MRAMPIRSALGAACLFDAARSARVSFHVDIADRRGRPYVNVGRTMTARGAQSRGNLGTGRLRNIFIARLAAAPRPGAARASMLRQVRFADFV